VEINVRENRRSKQEWAIQKPGNVRHTRHRTKTNRAKKTNKIQHRKLKWPATRTNQKTAVISCSRRDITDPWQ